MAATHTYTVIATAAGGQTASQNITLSMIDADVGVPIFGGLNDMPDLPVSDGCNPCCKITEALAMNMRIWRDHQAMQYTLDAPMPPTHKGTSGEVQIDSKTGQYAVYNNCKWRVYSPKQGLKIRRSGNAVCDQHTYTVNVTDSTNATVSQPVTVTLCNAPLQVFNTGSAWVAAPN